jgi:hypothetical protein
MGLIAMSSNLLSLSRIVSLSLSYCPSLFLSRYETHCSMHITAVQLPGMESKPPHTLTLILTTPPHSQVLTLANGDRIQMTAGMKAFFEPENLANASPATVSRAGIIYVSDIELGWKPIMRSWLQKRDATESEILQKLFDKYVVDRTLPHTCPSHTYNYNTQSLPTA